MLQGTTLVENQTFQSGGDWWVTLQETRIRGTHPNGFQFGKSSTQKCQNGKGYVSYQEGKFRWSVWWVDKVMFMSYSNVRHFDDWLVVSTQLKKRQIWSSPQVGVNIKPIWNHHPVDDWRFWCVLFSGNKKTFRSEVFSKSSQVIPIHF